MTNPPHQTEIPISVDLQQLEERLAVTANLDQRIILLVEISQLHLPVNVNKALEYCRLAQDAIEQTDSPACRALGMLCEASYCYEIGELKKSIRLLIQALRFAQGPNLETRGKVFMGIGTVFYKLKNLNGARSYFEQALQIFQELELAKDSCQVLFKLGKVEVRAGDFETALICFDRSLEVAQEHDLTSLKAQNLGENGIILQLQDRLDEALNYLNRGLQLFRSLNDSLGVATVLSEMANVYLKLDDFTQATKLKAEAVRLCEPIQNGFRLNEIYFQFADYLVRVKENSMAIVYLKKILQAEGQPQSFKRISDAHYLLAQIREQEGDLSQALSHYREYEKVRADYFKADQDSRIEDLTIQQEIERAKRDGELYLLKHDELAEAQKIAQLGSWEFNPNSDEFEGTDEFFRILGLAPKTYRLSRTEFLSFIHPEDRVFFMTAIENFVNDPNPLEIKTRIIKHGGEIRKVVVQGRFDPATPGSANIWMGTIQDLTEQHRREEERDRLLYDLQDALAKVSEISGLVPMCADCKKIRDDQGYWRNLETYFAARSEAQFTHGICPDCLHELYPQLYPDNNPPAESD